MGGLNKTTWVETLAGKAGLSDDDVYFKELVSRMPGYLLEDRSANTNKKYDVYFKKFKRFMDNLDKQSLPTNSMLVALYLAHLLDNGTSFSVIPSVSIQLKGCTVCMDTLIMLKI